MLECHHYSLAFLNSHDKPLCLLQIIALRKGELCGLRVFSREEACVSSSSGEEKIFNMQIYIATCKSLFLFLITDGVLDGAHKIFSKIVVIVMIS